MAGDKGDLSDARGCPQEKIFSFDHLVQNSKLVTAMAIHMVLENLQG